MYTQIIDDLLETGYYEVEPEVYLWTQKAIIEEQKTWDDEDPCKNFDFTKHLYWKTYNSMIEPEPYNSFTDYFFEA